MFWTNRIFAAAALLVCGLAGTAVAQDSGPAPGAAKWTPWIEFGGFYGSDDSSRAEGVLWVPFAQSSSSLLFGEARGKLFEDDMREGNFALGYRQMMRGGWNLGFWGGYDIRESGYGSTFRQLAGGLEALSGNWDFRANAYLPLNETETVFSTTSSTSSSAIDFSGNQIGLITTIETMTSRMDEVALWGFDGEVGYKLFATPDDLPGPHHELRVYAGAFHFDHSDLADSVTGPRLRAEWRMDDILEGWGGSRLTFEGEYSHDDLRDDRFEVGARLRLPFGAGTRSVSSRSLTAQERRMTEGLERDTDIVSSTKVTSTSTATTSTEAVEDARTGVRFDKVETVDASGDLSTVSANAGANTLIIADGSAGALSGAQVLQGNQTLQGGGATIQVRGVTSGNIFDFTAPGARPELLNTANSTVLTVIGSNTRVTGIDVEGQSGAGSLNVGIRGTDNLSNIRIDNVNIDSTGNTAILFGEGNAVTLSHVGITNAGGHGIYFQQRNVVAITGATVDTSTGRSIRFGSHNNATVTDSTLRNSGDGGIYIRLNNQVAISRVTVDNPGVNAIYLESGNTVAIDETTFTGTAGWGIMVPNPGNTISGTRNVASGASITNTLCDLAVGTLGQVTFDIGTCP